MIKANELRVGNLVNVAGIGVTEIDHLKKGVDYTELLPTPITKNLLLKAGYEYIKEIDGYADAKHVVYLHEDRIVFHPFCTNDRDCYIKIKSVHHWQNVVFAITQKELTFK